MKTLRVDIKQHSDREFKVVWNDEVAWPGYTILRPAVEGCAARIRQVLAELVDAALAGTLKQAAPLLRRLAEEGAALHRALFAALSGADDARRIHDFYAGSGEAYRLRFCVSDSVFVPWGLVYGADPTALPAAPDVGDWRVYEAFWCLRHELVTVYERIPPDAVGRVPDPAAQEVAWVAHQQALAAAEGCITRPAEQRMMAWLRHAGGQPLQSPKALDEHWRSRGRQTALLYFYCHASATRLALSDSESVEASDLFVLLSGAPRQPGAAGCLMLINGCSTAVGARSGDFILTASQPGMCGFVGTETDVPDLFALRFSLALLGLLLDKGLTLGEAMQRLLREHFPLSLVYGAYAHPGFRLAPGQALPPPLPRDGSGEDEKANFSFDPVGTNRLGARHGL